ncbi:hypothetical protein [Emticicia agri]|uniref:hypothetical protein n=1 Tax=Emticicia agri TaxID=2492393 RepID=UPI0013EE314C|nr:hypothetical protein [Emticicia agri]
MKTKINFKILDHSDIEFSGTVPLEEEQKAFSIFLAKRKKSKSKGLSINTVRQNP